MPAKDQLLELLKDQTPDVRIAAAEALCGIGESKAATPIFIEALGEKNQMVRVHALNSLEILGGDVAKAAIPRAKELIGDRDDNSYDLRAAIRLVEIYGD